MAKKIQDTIKFVQKANRLLKEQREGRKLTKAERDAVNEAHAGAVRRRTRRR